MGNSASGLATDSAASVHRSLDISKQDGDRTINAKQLGNRSGSVGLLTKDKLHGSSYLGRSKAGTPKILRSSQFGNGESKQSDTHATKTVSTDTDESIGPNSVESHLVVTNQIGDTDRASIIDTVTVSDNAQRQTDLGMIYVFECGTS
jgi:hypothetical protein